MTVICLRRLGFVVGQQIWVKLSWDLPLELAPHHWERYHRGECECLKHYVYRGQVTQRGFKLQRCRAAGKDLQGTTRWRPQGKVYHDGWQWVYQASRQGATVSFYPNQPQGGIGNHHVQQCHCLFYEIDDQPLAVQAQEIARLEADTGLVPAAVVYSGGKSLHVYFRSGTPLAPKDWLRLNRKLCIRQNSDPQICNLGRAMRMPGMVRRRVVNGALSPPRVVRLKANSPQSYGPDELELALDQGGLFPQGLDDRRWRRWVQLRHQAQRDATLEPRAALVEETTGLGPRQFPSPQPIPPLMGSPPSRRGTPHRASGIPLRQCLSQDDGYLIAYGAEQGYRHSNGYKLACNLVATAAFLEQEGVGYEPSAAALFYAYCDRCSPPMDSVESEQIWQDAQRRATYPSRPPESILNTVAYYQGRAQKQAQRQSRLRHLIQQVRARHRQGRRQG